MINIKGSSYHLLRVGMGITFLWIGILIFRDPSFWGGFLQPWAAGLLPIPLAEAMIATAILNIAIGIFLLIDVYVWIAAAVASIHLALILIVTGVDVITVRDIGLLAAGISLFWNDLPVKFKAQRKELGK